MGIDKRNVRLVIHCAMPGSLEAYYQEAGRAGRDGRHSDCVLLHAFQDRFTHEFFIKSANPDRAAVERVYETARRLADATGLVTASSAELAAAAGKEIKDREAESAIRVLVHSGALVSEPSSTSRLYVRLLAAPTRIREELGDEPAEIELLRSLWRAAGARLHDGAVIDPNGLPPGFGGASGVSGLLDDLQARQFITWERTGGGLRLTNPARSARSLDVDWSLLERRRRAEIAKLDAMQRYAYAKGCRRGFVLRYFGDPAAMTRCDGCDNCLGTTRSVEGTRRAPRAAGSSRAAKAPRRPAAVALPDELAPPDAALLEALKTLRGTLARSERVPAYCIFPDRTLVEMCVRRPVTTDALGEVRGVGPAKLEKYGARFLAAIRDADGTEAA